MIDSVCRSVRAGAIGMEAATAATAGTAATAATTAIDDGALDGTGAKRARTEEEPKGTMPPDLRDQIETSLAAIGQVEYKRRPHRKGPGPVKARTTKRRPSAVEVHSGSTSDVHIRSAQNRFGTTVGRPIKSKRRPTCTCKSQPKTCWSAV